MPKADATEPTLEVNQELIDDGWEPIKKPTSIVYMKGLSEATMQLIRDLAQFNKDLRKTESAAEKS